MGVRLKQAAEETGRAYEGPPDHSLGGYAAMSGMYLTAVGVGASVLAARGRRLPERPSPYDLGLLAVGTHRLSRLLTKAAVTSPLRVRFTRYTGPGGPAEVSEEPRRPGPIRHAVGELLSCPFCMDVWLVTGLGWGLLAAPRATRAVMGLYTALAGADFLHLAYARAQKGT